MEITTVLFAVFVILTGIGCRWLPPRIRNLWLLLASMVFIVTWSWKFLVSLLLLAVVNYLFGLLVSTRIIGKVVLWIGIVVNILALLVFKYSSFYLPELIAFLTKLGVHTGAGGLQILEPLGLSFIVVQMIAYLVDVRLQRMQAEKNIVKFALYALYFPKILAGPVERAKPFLARLDSPQKWSEESIRRDVGLVLVGLVRKTILADTLFSAIPADAFQQPSQYPGGFLALYLLAYAFALYNDFAGYTSIVRGISAFLGIELTNNFNLPYFARSFSEFWNRWHISLSNWLRDYIFFPLSRSLLKKNPDHNAAVHLIVPPMVTMLVSGMWHGMAWNTLVWGGLQGAFLILERLVTLGRPRVPLDQLPKWRQALSGLGVFVGVWLAWVPFHTTLPSAIRYWVSMIGIRHWPSTATGLASAPILVVLAFALGLDLIQAKDELRFLKWPGWLLSALLALLIVIFLLMSFAEKGAPFIDQGF